jgi:hypothetical protein
MKKSRFEKSQEAHYKLHWKHINKSIGNPRAEVKANYHNDVVTIQRKANRIIPKRERKILFKYNHQNVFPGKRNETKVKRNTYLGIFKKYGVDSY